MNPPLPPILPIRQQIDPVVGQKLIDAGWRKPLRVRTIKIAVHLQVDRCDGAYEAIWTFEPDCPRPRSSRRNRSER